MSSEQLKEEQEVTEEQDSTQPEQIVNGSSPTDDTPHTNHASKSEEAVEEDGEKHEHPVHDVPVETSTSDPEPPTEEDAVHDNVQKSQDDSTVTEIAAISNDEDHVEGQTAKKSTKQTKSKTRVETMQETDEKDEKIAALEDKLAQALDDNQQLDDKYRNLLGKVATIRTSLGDRLKQDADELAESRTVIEQLQEQNSEAQDRIESLKKELSSRTSENAALERDLVGVRNRLNVAQQNWAQEREEFEDAETYLREEYETAKKSMQDWEVLAMEESSVKKSLRERCDELEEQLASQRESYQILSQQRDKEYNTMQGLHQALDELQIARKSELREVVNNSQAQIEVLASERTELKSKVQVYESELRDAQKQVRQTQHFESEVKEKSLLIGKLRHEAVILNEHLTKALRMLKKGNQQDSVDRQLVTNLLLSFLGLPRGDPKKYEVLQLIASFLAWTDEQRESAGLARPGTSSSHNMSATGSMRSPSMGSFLRTPSSSGLSGEMSTENRESLAELWTQFLDQEASESQSSKPP